MSRLQPLSLDTIPELQELGGFYQDVFGFVPNGARIMAYRPEIILGFIHLRRAVMDPTSGTVPAELKSLIGHVASKAAGCRYCQAHTSHTGHRVGVDEAKLADVYDFENSDRFSDAERAALRLAFAAASVPNTSTPEHFADLRRHFDDEQIAAIVAVIALFGFLNRWNDTMGTELEGPARQFGERVLAGHGWDVGKHT